MRDPPRVARGSLAHRARLNQPDSVRVVRSRVDVRTEGTMQHVVTGIGADGRSTVLERHDLSEPPGDQVVVETVWHTDALPPELPQAIVGQGEASHVSVPA